MVNFHPTDGFIPYRDESYAVGVVHELQELDGIMAGGAAVIKKAWTEVQKVIYPKARHCIYMQNERHHGHSKSLLLC